MAGTPMMDTFYIAHGSPTLAYDETLPARKFLQSWKETVLSKKPSSILIISSHWETSEPIINAVDENDTIYDFDGLPPFVEEIKYAAPGSKELAERVKEVVKQSGFEREVKMDEKRGLDHGAWIPLMLMYPDADIPVCQLSIQTDKDATYHYRLGQALAPLKEEGVLIIGSGMTTHNLRNIMAEVIPGFVAPWAFEFDNWLNEALVNGRYEEVNDWEKKAPHAKIAHPSPDHFYPLHVAMGAADGGSMGKLIHHSWSRGTFSYASYQFCSTTASATV